MLLKEYQSMQFDPSWDVQKSQISMIYRHVMMSRDLITNGGLDKKDLKSQSYGAIILCVWKIWFPDNENIFITQVWQSWTTVLDY